MQHNRIECYRSVKTSNLSELLVSKIYSLFKSAVKCKMLLVNNKKFIIEKKVKKFFFIEVKCNILLFCLSVIDMKIFFMMLLEFL